MYLSVSRSLIALCLLFTLSATAIAGGPTLSLSIPYALVPGGSDTVHVEHGLGYIPQVQAVTGSSSIRPHVFVITDHDLWLSLRNEILPPSIVQQGDVRIDLW